MVGHFTQDFIPQVCRCAGAWILCRGACLSLRALQPSASRARVASPLPPCPQNMVAFAPRRGAMCPAAMPGPYVNFYADGCINHLPGMRQVGRRAAKNSGSAGRTFLSILHQGSLHDRGWFRYHGWGLPVRLRSASGQGRPSWCSPQLTTGWRPP